MQTQLYCLKALTGLHCGAGAGLGDIDLPVARDVVTGHPYIPGSSLKGVLHDHLGNNPAARASAEFTAIFGGKDLASGVAFGDARLLCLPVRSFHGTFAYLTSPLVLTLFAADLKQAGFDTTRFSIPKPGPFSIALPTDSALRRLGTPSAALLEEFNLSEQSSARTQADDWMNFLVQHLRDNTLFDPLLFTPRFGIVGDAVFDFFCEAGLPVAMRNSIGDNGTAEDQALWSEESLPAETMLAGLLHATPVRHGIDPAAALTWLARQAPGILQLGGKATTGRGLAALSLPPAQASASSAGNPGVP